MRMGGGIIPQYTHNIPSEEGFGGYWCPEDSEMRHGSNQHNNQLIYYIRDIKVMRQAHSYAIDDQILGVDYVC